MKSKKLTYCLCMAALTLSVSGCSQSDAETINFNDSAVTSASEPSSVSENNNQPESESEQDNNQSQLTETLDGDVESIGNNEVVINKTFYPSENEAVSYNDEKVLVNVKFSAETTFKVYTVKNGGVNGDDDVTKQDGSSSDIKIRSHLQMIGSYEGNDFNAAEVIIYRYE